jgi:hypothetical protein
MTVAVDTCPTNQRTARSVGSTAPAFTELRCGASQSRVHLISISIGLTCATVKRAGRRDP